ncbi:hypothetical protein D3C77_428290 [compost metagenome]
MFSVSSFPRSASFARLVAPLAISSVAIAISLAEIAVLFDACVNSVAVSSTSCAELFVCLTSCVICSIITLKLAVSIPISSLDLGFIRTLRFPFEPSSIRFFSATSGRAIILTIHIPIRIAIIPTTPSEINVVIRIHLASLVNSSVGSTPISVQPEFSCVL